MTLVSGDDHILPGHSPAVRRRMVRGLSDADVTVKLNARAERVSADSVTLATGDVVEADITILTTGAAAPKWFSGTGLALDKAGFIKTNQFLHSTSHPEVFAAGDCASFQPTRLPKSGVYAVRQGPPLAANLRRAAIGEPMASWTPQKVTLSLMSTGDSGAVVSYGRFAASGDWAWTWKDRIDKQWMEKHSILALMPPMPPPAQTSEAPAPMRCGGCGAKVASPILRRVLDRLGLSDGAGDDAAILHPPPGKALVQTVDQFRSFIDDPFLFGEIATIHALGDLYATGATPDSALVTAILPHAGEAAIERDLMQLMAGVQRALGQAGADLIGGHTGEGAELSLGLSLNGYCDAVALSLKGGAQVGDCLILTKPLGIGAIMAADMRGEADNPVVEAAIASMRLSTGASANILTNHGVHAMTDVTGFGLAGHLIEMADGSRVAAALNLDTLPALPGAIQAIQQGIESSMAPANAAFVERIAGLPATTEARLLYDPQTAGGLLAAISKDNLQAALTALQAAGYTDACMIGRFVDAASPATTIQIA
jgi:selenide,water dikinase